MIFNVSGGGTALNFRVVGGTTAPANPAENCIWVNTDNPITSWLFSATEPSPAEAGMVWITIGSSSSASFNALKKNGIQVYPISAKQYVNGAWVDKEARSYQGGKWAEWWTGQLYTPGNEWTFVTGGWAARAWSCNRYAFGKLPTLTKGNESMTISLASSEHQSGVVEVLKDIDLTEINILRAKFKSVTMSGVSATCELHFIVVGRNVKYYYDNRTAGTMEKYSSAMTKNDVVHEIDVTALTGSHDIVIGLECSVSGQALTAVLESVVME